MKKFGLALLLFTFSNMGHSLPLSLDYQVSDIGGGLFNYEFSLELDNQDGSWVAGQGWRWFIFGDAPVGTQSPLTNFVGDTGDLPVGPWTMFTTTSGGHNGPTFGHVIDYWVPTAIGETLNWSGTSTADLAQGELLFSTIAGTLNGAVAANFEVANRVNAVSEPSVFALLLLGIFSLRLSRIRFAK